MEIKCPNCGVANWLENQSRCFQCNTVLRRCVDCDKYDPQQQFCRALGTEIERGEAEDPSVLSVSVNCPSFRPLSPGA